MRTRRTKIIATVGPASSSDAVIASLIAAGVDIFRGAGQPGTVVALVRISDNIGQGDANFLKLQRL